MAAGSVPFWTEEIFASFFHPPIEEKAPALPDCPLWHYEQILADAEALERAWANAWMDYAERYLGEIFNEP